MAKTNRLITIRGEVKAAAIAAGAADADDVVLLAGSRFSLDEKTGKVVSDDTTNADPLAFMTAYLVAKPHLAKPRVGTGSGAAPTPGIVPAPKPLGNHDMKSSDGATAALNESINRLLGL